MLKATFDHIPATLTGEVLADSMLIMEVGEKQFSYFLYQQDQQRFNGFRQYHFDQVMDLTPVEILEDIIAQDDLLQQKVKESAIIYNFPDSNLLPNEGFSIELNKPVVELLNGDSNKGLVLSEKVYEWNVHNVYRVPRGIHTLLQKKFAAGKYWHYYSLLLSATAPETVPENIFIRTIFYRHRFIAMVFNNQSLLLIRSFEYTTAEDVLYHLLSVCHYLELPPAEVHLLLSGLIDEQSNLYSELLKYFLHIEWEPIDSSLQGELPGGDLPAHYFSPLLNMAVCV